MTAGEPAQRPKKLDCDALTEADWRRFLELKIPEDLVIGYSSCMCQFYVQKLNQVLIINMRGEFPRISSKVREKEPFGNMPGHSVLKKAYRQGELVNQSLTCGDISEPTAPGKQNAQLHYALSNHYSENWALGTSQQRF